MTYYNHMGNLRYITSMLYYCNKQCLLGSLLCISDILSHVNRRRTSRRMCESQESVITKNAS